MVALLGFSPEIALAAVDSMEIDKARAWRICTGTADDVIIQAAVDLAGTYESKGSGCRVRCARGNFNLAATVNVHGHVSIQGDQLGGTQLNLVPGSNCDLLNHAPTTDELGFELWDLTLNGNRYHTVNDGGVQLGCIDRITGQVKAGNTDATGQLYVSIVDDTGGYRHIDFYKDSGRAVGNLVAHTATYNTTGLKAIVADNGSGLGGYIGVLAVGAADADIYLAGNWTGRGFWGNDHSIEGKFHRIEVMDFGGHGIQIDEAYEWIFDDVFPNVNNGHGLYITGGTRARILKCRCTNNALDGLYLAASTCEIQGLIAWTGLYQDAVGTTGLHQQTYAGVRATGNHNIFTNLQVSSIRTGNFGVYNSGSQNQYLGVDANKATGATSTVGVFLGGAQNKVIGGNVASLATGVQFSSSNNTVEGVTIDACTTALVCSGNQVKIVGNSIENCTTGLSTSSVDRLVVAGNDWINNTTAIVLGATTDGWSIAGNVFDGGTTGLSFTSGAGNTVPHLVVGNQFVGVGTPVAGTIGQNKFYANQGCVNYSDNAWAW